jgi:hypothetical protein
VIELRVDGGHRAAVSLSRIKALAWDHPGEEELVLIVPSVSRPDPTRLSLGPAWRYGHSAVEPLSLFGDVRIVPEGEPPPGNESVHD